MIKDAKPNAIAQNCNILANAAALVAGVIGEMGDKDIAPRIGEENLSRDQVEQLALNRLSQTL